MLSLRPRAPAARQGLARAAVRVAPPALLRHRAPRHVMRASSGKTEFDFDAWLASLAEKWEKSDNKVAIAGYGAAAVLVFFTAEWLIHLPALDVLLGFPIQLIGLLALPYFGLRYFVEGVDFSKDIDTYTAAITKKLPGLDK